MKRNVVGFLSIAACAALMASGCAKKELVKKDESIAPVANTAVKPAVNNETAQTAVKPAPIQETNLNGEANQSMTNEQLQADLEKIYFGFNSYDLSDAARAALSKDSDLLQKKSAIKVLIAGNCDERGSAEYNLALGEKRAQAAKKYLETMGIPAADLSTISYGKEKPADPGHNEAAWAKNRRDEFVVQ
jgi:peptidoglycan-associated lipoprotein